MIQNKMNGKDPIQLKDSVLGLKSSPRNSDQEEDLKLTWTKILRGTESSLVMQTLFMIRKWTSMRERLNQDGTTMKNILTQSSEITVLLKRIFYCNRQFAFLVY